MSPERPFQPYGPAHLTVIFLTIALPFALAAIARRARSSRVERAIIATLSALLVLNYAVYLILVRNVSVMSWEQMLPLQLCDWGMVVVIVAMWSGSPCCFEVAYFWGIGGTRRAALTPHLRFGFPDFRGVSFLLSHAR